MGVEINIEADKLEKYRDLIAGLDIEDPRKDEMIEIIVNIMQAFVDNAFGIGGSQLALAKGQLSTSFHSAAGATVQTVNNELCDPANKPSDHIKPEP